ncbi:aldose 1-epimerase family protein [Lentilactobacillus sp. TOM.63]|uniref:aldose 1-epimerase family protein n=1 Tax=Lentilactobacillus TaxID=2767893 RepID=UPI001C27283B|nr:MULTISPECIES: aldose 1-epimerase family protein [Lentilactobacillus]MBU9789013.1 aldose 1-epimerase family protein [Lentilactobacillus dabitei]MDM7517376.1 aldose 1-epimerase family protein [Lentilactobacillus sp. TOM.63]
MITLKNQYLSVQINEFGAELSSVHENDGERIEYIWQANPNYWKRHAPILFPIVGRLKDNQYQYNHQTYEMTQHGFARDNFFDVVDQDDNSVQLELKDNEETLQHYPFHFRLRISYQLVGHALKVQLSVFNPNDDQLLFSIGAHPGFNVSLIDGQGTFKDAFVRVAPKKNYQRTPLKPPYSDPENPRELDLTKPLALKHKLFENDALILNLDHQETTMMLASTANDHGVAVTVFNAPYVGIWSPYPKKAPFVCIEPWWGLADPVDSDGILAHKFAINELAGKQTFDAKYEISFF